jgi:hypothetical protein
MTWFYVDDKFGESTKVKRIPRGQRLAAIGLWTMAGQWSAGQLTDGHVPTYMVDELGGSARLAATLVTCGLWEQTTDGYVFHDWADWQQTRVQVEKKRADARARMAKLRGGSSELRPNIDVTSGEVQGMFATPIPSLPVPTQEVLSELPSVHEVKQDFSIWYALFPKHQKRPDAERAYVKARKRVDAETLLEGAKRWAEVYEGDNQFCPMPATWLNNDQWNDETPKQKSGNPRQQQTDDMFARAAQRAVEAERKAIA